MVAKETELVLEWFLERKELPIPRNVDEMGASTELDCRLLLLPISVIEYGAGWSIRLSLCAID
jgi:hypothetical protein